jgi:hypothetical protein
MTTALPPRRLYVVPTLTTVDLRAKSALAERELSKLSIFAQPAPPPTSTSNVEGGVVFGPAPRPGNPRSSGR